MFNIDEIKEELHDDGGSYVVTDDSGEWTFKVSVEPDDLTVEDIEDPEVFGRYQYADWRNSRDPRPDGFTGAAVKITSASDQGTFFWYEPPIELRRFKGSGFPTVEAWEAAKAKNLEYVRNLLSWGYVTVVVKVTHERSDGYEREWYASLGGVESGTGLWGESLNAHDVYVADLIGELIEEVVGEIEEALVPA